MNDNQRDIDEILKGRIDPPDARHDLAAQIVQSAFAQKPPNKVFLWFFDMRRARPVLILAVCFIIGLAFSGVSDTSSPTAEAGFSNADLLLSGDDLFDWDDSYF